MRLAVITGMLVSTLIGQTTIDLRSQSKNVDFSGFSSTRPAKTGASLPATCGVAELFFLTSAPAGSNWYGCTAPNQWALEGSGGGGGASSSQQLSDCRASVNASTLTVEPCQVALGANVFAITSNAIATLSGSAVSGSAYVYWDAAGRLTIDHNTAATITCNQACDIGSTGGIPTTSIPVAIVTFGGGQFNPPLDRRAVYSTRNTFCGDGLKCLTDGITGGLEISMDATVLGQATLPASGRGAWSSRPTCTSALTGQSYYVTDGNGLVSQCDGLAWSDYYLFVPIARPTAASNFTVVNGGTLTDTTGIVTFVKNTNGVGAALLPIPTPSATWEVRLGFTASAWSNTHECGIAVTNGVNAGSSTLRSLVISAGTSGSAGYFARSYSPMNGALADNGLSAGAAIRMSPLAWMRVTRDGTNTLSYYIGEDGAWTLVKTVAFGSQPTHYGVACDPRGSDPVTMRVWSLAIQ